MIHIDKDGRGYWHGDKVAIERKEPEGDLVRFVFLEGHRKGKYLQQPEESVFCEGATP